MSATVLGQTTTVERYTAKSWTYFDGERQERMFVGPASAVEALYNNYKQVAGNNPEFDALTFDPGRGLGTLRVSKGEDGEAQYECMPNDFWKRIELSAYFASLSGDQIHAARVAFEQGKAITEAPVSSFSSLAKELYGYWQMGHEEYSESGYVLRSTLTVSKRTTAAANYADVNRVSEPPNVRGINELIGALPAGEWLKKAPAVRRIGPRKWQITQEWWWAEKWAKYLGGTL